MNKLLVDTSAWFSYFVARDPDHEAVADVLEQWEGRLLTTDFVFDELVTLLRYRTSHADAVRVGEALRQGMIAQLVLLESRDIDAAWQRFVRDDDKRISFTDCTSFALMDRLGIKTAAAVDIHFRQASYNVLPAP